mgnify:CR=1 FL=1
MINIETICFLLVVVGSLALFYYLGYEAGREQAVNEILVWNDEEEEEE